MPRGLVEEVVVPRLTGVRLAGLFGAAVLAFGALAPVSAHAAAASVSFAGAGDSKFVVHGEAFSLDLKIESPTPAKDHVTVELTPLLGPDGTAVAGAVRCTLGGKGECSQGADLTGLGSLAVNISGTLPTVGMYVLIASIVTPKERSSSRLSITRAWVAPALNLDVPDALTGTADELGNVTVVVGERGGLSPSVKLRTTPARVRSGGSLVQQATAHAAASQPLVLLPLADSQPQVLPVAGIDGPGEYRTEVVAEVDGWMPLRKTVKLMVHLPCGVAVLAILLGVAASFVFRFYNLVKRASWAKLDALRKVRMAVVAAVSSLDDPEVKDAARILGAQSQALEEELRTSRQAPDDSAERMSARLRLLPLWANAFRLARSLDPGAVAELLAKLRALEDEMLNPASVAEGLADQIKSVIAELEKLVASSLKEPIVAFQKVLVSAGDQYPEITKAVALALSLVSEGKNREARESYEAARVAYTVKTAQKLLGELSKENALAGAAGAPLLKAVSAVLAGADGVGADVLAARLRDAFLPIVRMLCQSLMGQIEDGRASVRNKQSLGEPDKADLLSRLDAVRKLAADAAVVADPDAAFGGYKRARDAWSALRERIPADVLREKPPEIPVALWLPGAVSAAPLRLAMIRDLPVSPSEQSRRKRIEVGMGLATAVAAVLIGMQSLGVSAPTWGGTADLIKAFLWGLGVNQAAGAVFLGIPGLQRDLGKG